MSDILNEYNALKIALEKANEQIAELTKRNNDLLEQIIALQREQSVNLGRS